MLQSLSLNVKPPNFPSIHRPINTRPSLRIKTINLISTGEHMQGQLNKSFVLETGFQSPPPPPPPPHTQKHKHISTHMQYTHYADMHTHTRVILVRAHVGKMGGFSNGQANHIPSGLESGHCLFMRYILQVTIIHLNKDRGSCNRKHDIGWSCTTLREVVVGGGGGGRRGGDGQVTVIHLNKDSKHLHWKAWHWCYTIGWRWGMAGEGGGGGGGSPFTWTQWQLLQKGFTMMLHNYWGFVFSGGEWWWWWRTPLGVVCFQSSFHY